MKLLLLVAPILIVYWLRKPIGRLFKKDPILPTGQRLSEVNAMRDRAIRTGNQHIPPVNTQKGFSVSVQVKEVEPPKKDASKEKMIVGKPCRIQWFSDFRDVLKVKDQDDRYHDPRRWIDVFYDGERHGYTWKEGYWTHSSGDIEYRDDIERWICEELGLYSQHLELEQISTTSTFERNGKIHISGDAGELKVSATINKKGYVAYIETNGFFETTGKLNIKSSNIELPVRLEPSAEAISRWLIKEISSAQNKES